MQESPYGRIHSTAAYASLTSKDAELRITVQRIGVRELMRLTTLKKSKSHLDRLTEAARASLQLGGRSPIDEPKRIQGAAGGDLARISGRVLGAPQDLEQRFRFVVTGGQHDGLPGRQQYAG